MTRVPPHVAAPSSGYHVLPVRTIALIGLKPVRRRNLGLRCRRWVKRVVSTSCCSLPVYPQIRTYQCIALNDAKGHERTCYGFLFSVVAIQMPQNTASKPVISWVVIGSP